MPFSFLKRNRSVNAQQKASERASRGVLAPDQHCVRARPGISRGRDDPARSIVQYKFV